MMTRSCITERRGKRNVPACCPFAKLPIFIRITDEVLRLLPMILPSVTIPGVENPVERFLHPVPHTFSISIGKGVIVQVG